MTDPFVAEIRIFGFNFPPRGWAFCDGQLLPLSQNTALFSLLGTMYGGNGESNFGLPNLQDSAANGFGQSPGTSEFFQGQESGSPGVTLLQSEIPHHSHLMRGSDEPAELQAPGESRALAHSSRGFAYQSDSTNSIVQMAPQALAPSGGGLPHENRQPFLTLNFCIALQGVFPQRG